MLSTVAREAAMVNLGQSDDLAGYFDITQR